MNQTPLFSLHCSGVAANTTPSLQHQPGGGIWQYFSASSFVANQAPPFSLHCSGVAENTSPFRQHQPSTAAAGLAVADSSSPAATSTASAHIPRIFFFIVPSPSP